MVQGREEGGDYVGGGCTRGWGKSASSGADVVHRGLNRGGGRCATKKGVWVN